jgi:hypothetical protein
MTAQPNTPLAPVPGSPDTILRRVRSYMELHRRATLGDLALHFNTPAPAMRGMLETWERKGRIRRLEVRATCNVSCPLACDDTSMTIYAWVDRSGSTPAESRADDTCRQRG